MSGVEGRLDRLAELVRAQGAAAERGDWTAFSDLRGQTEAAIAALGVPDPSFAARIESLIEELDGVQRRLATRHDLTGQLLRYLSAHDRSGRAIDTTY